MLRQLAVLSPQVVAPPNTPARLPSGPLEMKPVDPQLLSVMTTQVNLFYGSFRKAEVDDPDTFTAGCLRLFTAYPLQAVQFVIDPVTGLPGRSEWLPSLKAVRDALEAFQDERRGRRKRPRVPRRKSSNSPRGANGSSRKTERPMMEELRARYGENWGWRPRRAMMAERRGRAGARRSSARTSARLRGVRTGGAAGGQRGVPELGAGDQGGGLAWARGALAGRALAAKSMLLASRSSPSRFDLLFARSLWRSAFPARSVESASAVRHDR